MEYLCCHPGGVLRKQGISLRWSNLGPIELHPPIFPQPQIFQSSTFLFTLSYIYPSTIYPKSNLPSFLSIYPSVHPSIYIHTHLILPSTHHPSIYPLPPIYSIYPTFPIPLHFHPSTLPYPFTLSSIHLSHLSIHSPFQLSVLLFNHPPIHQPTHIFHLPPYLFTFSSIHFPFIHSPSKHFPQPLHPSLSSSHPFSLHSYSRVAILSSNIDSGNLVPGPEVDTAGMNKLCLQGLPVQLGK